MWAGGVGQRCEGRRILNHFLYEPWPNSEITDKVDLWLFCLLIHDAKNLEQKEQREKQKETS
jgi:hypothetical protein